MTEIYRQTFRMYFRALPMLLGLMAFVEIILWYLEPRVPMAATLVPALIVLYQFHRHFLFGEAPLALGKPSPDAPPFKIGRFFLVSLALLVLPLAVAGAIFISTMPDAGVSGMAYTLFFVALALLYLLTLGMFGLALPAAVARSGAFQLSSGVKHSIGTMWRLLAGPALVQLLLLGTTMGLFMITGVGQAYETAPGMIAINAVLSTLGFLPSALGVAVLCHQYQKATGTLPQPSRADQF